MTFDDIAEAQGWNRDSQFNIICGFIERTEQWEAVMLHAQEVADCENGEGF